MINPNLQRPAMDAIAHGTVASDRLRSMFCALSVGGVDRARERLQEAQGALQTFELALHLMEAKLAMAEKQFGAAVEATLAARNCFNRLPAEERAAYLDSVLAVEKEVADTFSASASVTA